MTQPKPNTMDDLGAVLDKLLICSCGVGNLPVGQHYDDCQKAIKAKLEALITAKLQEAPQPTDNLCFDCGNKLFLWDGKYRCIYDGKTQELASLKGGDV